MARFAICYHDGIYHIPKYLQADSTFNHDEDNLGVLAEQNEDDGYIITNRWADGTVGITPYAKECAESDDSPICSIHFDEVNHWEDIANPIIDPE